MNWNTVVALVVGLVGVLLTTKWGLAHKKALELVAKVLETADVNKTRDDAKGIKEAIKIAAITVLKPSAKEALEAVVAKLDAKKKPVSKGKRLVRFIGKALLGLALKRFR